MSSNGMTDEKKAQVLANDTERELRNFAESKAAELGIPESFVYAEIAYQSTTLRREAGVKESAGS